MLRRHLSADTGGTRPRSRSGSDRSEAERCSAVAPESELLDAGVKGSGCEAEPRGGAGRAQDAPAGLVQRSHDLRAFDVGEGWRLAPPVRCAPGWSQRSRRCPCKGLQRPSPAGGPPGMPCRTRGSLQRVFAERRVVSRASRGETLLCLSSRSMSVRSSFFAMDCAALAPRCPSVW